MANQNNEMLTRKEAARYLKVCLLTVDRLNIPRFKVRHSVRFMKSDIDVWIETRKATPQVRAQ